MSSFLTVEDVNTVSYSNQSFYWHEIDTSKISSTTDYTNTQYDFCKVTRQTLTNNEYLYKYTVTVFASNFANLYYWKSMNGVLFPGTSSYNHFMIWTDEPAIKIYAYMGNFTLLNAPRKVYYCITTKEFSLNYKELQSSQTIHYKDFMFPNMDFTKNVLLEKGYNRVHIISDIYDYVFVNLLKTNFQFTCNQSLTVGKVNKVALGTDTDYKPNGDLVGSYTPKITVEYNNQILPVTYDETLNDYVFNLDLTNQTETGKIRFKVNVKSNEVLNATSTDVVLESQYETISTFADLKTACGNNGTDLIRLGANITLTSSIPVTHSIKIIGNDKTLNMSSHNFVLSEDVTFNAEKVTFNGGKATILQATNTTVTLTNCTFTGCTGTGSCIKCDIELHSLDNPTDFTTILTNCTFTNNDMCILHGGDLTVTGCTVTGKISDYKYPYFLYQTDGTARITQNTFSISNNSTINTDIEFNSCIFICGETAQINNLSHSDLQNNNLTSFLESPQSNSSTINLTYYYDLIEDNITLQSSKGYCHSISGSDYVFKNNVTVNRS